MSFETFVARRFLKIKSRRKLVPLITILATLGVAVGVMVLIVVIAVMTGFQSELKRRILGIEAHLTVMRYNEYVQDYPAEMRKIEQVTGVTAVQPHVYAQGMLRAAGGLSAVMLKGIDPERAQVRVKMRGDRDLNALLNQTASDDAQGAADVVLGKVLADKLKVGVGDGLLVMVVGAQQADPRQLPGMQRLKVVGLFDTGMHQYDGVMGFVNLKRLQHMAGVTDRVNGFEVRVDDVDQVEEIGRRILGQLGSNYWISDWKYMHRNLFHMLGLQKLMMYVILTLIIVVASFNIASALIMMVKDKVKDIAILKVMGASSRSIQSIFLRKGLAIGLVGICLGICGGLILYLILDRYPFIELPGDVYFLTTLPVRISPIDLTLIALGTLAICVAASLYPALQAAKLKPVDGVRLR
jgi:lipoprotein-releasing system permease protein